jgi:hypothetical protein
MYRVARKINHSAARGRFNGTNGTMWAELVGNLSLVDL